MIKLGHISGNWNRVAIDFYSRLTEKYPNLSLVQIHNPDSPPYSEDIKTAYGDMVDSAKCLADTGVTHVAIACNTMHLQRTNFITDTGLTMLDMVGGTKQAAIHCGYKQIGILGTITSMTSGLYDSAGYTSIYPDDQDQQLLQKYIVSNKHVTRRADIQDLGDLIDRFTNQHPQMDAQLVGCTDLPTLVPQKKYAVPFLDPIDILVDLCGSIHNP